MFNPPLDTEKLHLRNLRDILRVVKKAVDNGTSVTIMHKHADTAALGIEELLVENGNLNQRVKAQADKIEDLNIKIDELESVLYACSCGVAHKN